MKLAKYDNSHDSRYVVVNATGNLRLIEKGRAWYTPAGWHRPHRYHQLRPAKKRVALITIPGLVTRANNARIVPPDVCEELDGITAEILNLRRKFNAIIKDNFLTFPLVVDGDLERSHEEIFSTKQEANNASD